MSDATQINLPERFDIASVEDVHQQMEDALTQGKAVVIEGSAVTRLDTAALQLLVAFHAEAGNTHMEVSWAEPSSTIHQVFDFMQLGEHVGLSSPQAGAQ